MIIQFHKFLPFYIIFILIGTFERITSTFFQKQKKVTEHIYYKWSFFILLFTYLFILLFSIGEFFLKCKDIIFEISFFGFIIFFSGILLRWKAISNLGNNWSMFTEIKEDQVLIVNGIYRFLKHPYYLAVLLELTGICLIANAFYSVALVFLIQMPLLLIRISLEEKVLIAHFGEAYKRYKSNKIL